MGKIFISHSGRNNGHAIALRDWLIANGWNEFFLDLDPKRGIVAGERWERALYKAANRCDAVLFIVSEHWISSESPWARAQGCWRKKADVRYHHRTCDT